MTFKTAIAYMQAAIKSAADAHFVCRTKEAAATHRAAMLAKAANFQSIAIALASK